MIDAINGTGSRYIPATIDFNKLINPVEEVFKGEMSGKKPNYIPANVLDEEPQQPTPQSEYTNLENTTDPGLLLSVAQKEDVSPFVLFRGKVMWRKSLNAFMYGADFPGQLIDIMV